MNESLENIHPSLRELPHHKVFLTGATGLIGGQLLHDLLLLPQVEEVRCLVRPNDGRTGIERLALKLKRAGGVKGKQLERAMTRVRAADGDVSCDLWGLDAAELAWIRNECDLFIHCAASISFTDGISNEAINVVGTRNMLDVLRGARSIKRFVPFSTATLCGYVKDCLMAEDEGLSGNDHIIAYTRSKATAEKMIRAAAAELPPLLIIRPGAVVAYGSRDRKQARLFLWSLVAMAQLPYMRVRREGLVDIVTVDFVVKSTLRLIARGDRLKHNCYHTTAGTRASVSCGDIYDIACSTSTRSELPKMVPPEEWNETHEQAIADQNLSAVWDSLQVYIPFLEMNQVYDNTRLIEELGDDLPDLLKFTDYMNEMIATINPQLVTMAANEGFTT
ncbi:MAG TPA: SDR family oxidoreductase [Planctomycetota bacterium]|nr:SDR family oxidoreductase [Planctomycetota bacterium]HUV39901.1 SDR family oxidoreductase [Planctomycetota bacterium]